MKSIDEFLNREVVFLQYIKNYLVYEIIELLVILTVM
jgi:hypothetical protein